MKGEIEVIGQCGICHLGIKHTDDYVKVIDYIKGKEAGSFYYHRNCFRDRLKGDPVLRALQKKADWILDAVAKKVTD